MRKKKNKAKISIIYSFIKKNLQYLIPFFPYPPHKKLGYFKALYEFNGYKILLL